VKERQAKAMADPEVQNILMDPIMRQVGGKRAEHVPHARSRLGKCVCGQRGMGRGYARLISAAALRDATSLLSVCLCQLQS